MKIINLKGKIIVYLTDIEDINFMDNNELEDYFRNLFLKLKRYHMYFTGLYNIDIYLDKNYGAVIEIEKEDFEYIDYFENEIDMRILLHEKNFLYEVKDIFALEKNTMKNVYYYNHKFFVEPNLKDDNTKIKLSEMGEIIYQPDDILRYGKKIKQNT